MVNPLDFERQRMIVVVLPFMTGLAWHSLLSDIHLDFVFGRCLITYEPLCSHVWSRAVFGRVLAGLADGALAWEAQVVVLVVGSCCWPGWCGRIFLPRRTPTGHSLARWYCRLGLAWPAHFSWRAGVCAGGQAGRREREGVARLTATTESPARRRHDVSASGQRVVDGSGTRQASIRYISKVYQSAGPGHGVVAGREWEGIDREQQRSHLPLGALASLLSLQCPLGGCASAGWFQASCCQGPLVPI